MMHKDTSANQNQPRHASNIKLFSGDFLDFIYYNLNIYIIFIVSDIRLEVQDLKIYHRNVYFELCFVLQVKSHPVCCFSLFVYCCLWKKNAIWAILDFWLQYL